MQCFWFILMKNVYFNQQQGDHFHTIHILPQTSGKY